MTGIKKSVWLGGTSAMLVMSALSIATSAAASPPTGFVPPQTELLLIRTLQRPLADGKALIVRRSYAVRIIRDGAGYRVDGNFVDAQVEAPPALRALAEIERRRSDEGLFPILLDAQGMIIGGDSVQSDGSQDRAASVARETISGSNLPALDKRQAQSFVDQLVNRSARSQWPADIFHPAPGKRSETRLIELPGGGQGQVTIGIETSNGKSSGQIAFLDRTVTTDLDGDRRITRERWQLCRIPGNMER